MDELHKGALDPQEPLLPSTTEDVLIVLVDEHQGRSNHLSHY